MLVSPATHIPGQHYGARAEHSFIPALRPGHWPVSIDNFLYTATGNGIGVLLHYAGHGFFRLCHAYREHASGLTVGHFLGPTALLSSGLAWRISKRYRAVRLVAANGCHGDLRIRDTNGQRGRYCIA